MNRPGAVLLIVLWLLILLGLVVLGLNRSGQLLAGEAGAAVGQTQARWAARAGVEAVLDLLHTDVTPEDGPTDLWWDDPATFEAVELAEGFTFTVQTPGLTEGVVRFGPADLGGRLPINAATTVEIAALPSVSDDNAAAIKDWRDADDDVTGGGAERAAYDALELPLDIRNGPVRTLEELRLVEGVDGYAWAGDPETGVAGLATLATPYSYDPNVAAGGQEKLQVDSLDGDTLQTRFNFSSGLVEAVEDADELETVFDLVGLEGDGEAERGELDTIGAQWVNDRVEEFVSADDAEDERGPGRVNINTAPRDVLVAMLGEEAAAEVEAGRVGAGFTSLGDLVRQGILEQAAFEAVAARLTVRSRVFEVTSTGTAPGGRTATLRVVIDRMGDTERPVVRWAIGGG